ncbi:MAG: hypothetical protein HY909_22960 [Deltaproteobacteria bacterium]|nr:hypothetical protein [Deltaproteobacteria bacterium]
MEHPLSAVRAAGALVALCLWGCRTPAAPAPRDAATGALDARWDAPTDAAPGEVPGDAPGDARPSDGPSDTAPATAGQRFRGQDVDALLRAMATRPAVAMLSRHNLRRPVFQLDLGGGLQVAFKPDTYSRHGLWRNDVVAWELARLLGLTERVPPVTGRTFPLALLGPRDRDLRPEDGHRDQVYGSTIFWMPVLARTRLHGPRGRALWSAWLSQRNPLPTEPAAEEVSSLVVFDYLQANVDRWGVYNTRADELGHLCYRDNNETWNSAPLANLGTNADLLRSVERFSRGLLARLEAADEAALREALRPWAEAGRPVLAEGRYAHYARRRAFVLAHVRALVARHGEARVFPWP